MNFVAAQTIRYSENTKSHENATYILQVFKCRDEGTGEGFH